MKRLGLLLAMILVSFSSVFTQAKKREFIGMMQIITEMDTTGQSQIFPERSRVRASGHVLPKVSTRFQYDFASNMLMDTYVSFHHIPNLEIRVGKSWLPFVGEFKKAPRLLDMVDFTVGVKLFPSREQGIFLLGKYRSFSYSLSLVNGTGHKKEDNKYKDVFGFLKYKLYFLEVGVGHYEGRDGADSALTIQRRTAVDFVVNIDSALTFKGAYIQARDSKLYSKGGWLRILAHLNGLIDITGEYDVFKEGDIKTRYFTVGLNHRLPIKYSNIKANYRQWLQPVSKRDLRIQFQILYPLQL